MLQKIRESIRTNNKLWLWGYLLFMVAISCGLIQEVSTRTDMNPTVQGTFGLMLMVMFVAVVWKVTR